MSNAVSHFILEHLAVPLTFFTTGVVRTTERTTTVLKYKMRNDFDTWSRSFIINNDIHTIIIEIESVVGIPSKSKLQSNAFDAFKLG